MARNLPNVAVPFASARLYQAAQWGPNKTEPSEAFQAAIDTNTTLLVGLWLPIDAELEALDNGFKKHGQKLADLVIGIAVGNEDIYRGSDDCTKAEGKPCAMTATPEEVMGDITHVKNEFQQRGWDKLFKTLPPIGHADTAPGAALQNADFAGVNIFPFWHHDPIDGALASFNETPKGVQDRAGQTPVWITETGWPSAGSDKAASVENMQKYWLTVGCSLFGRYNTFWFELDFDSHDIGSLDGGSMDKCSQKPKISDLSCPNLPGPSSPASPVQPPISTSIIPGMIDQPVVPEISTLAYQSGGLSNEVSTVHVTITSTIVVQPAPSASVIQTENSQTLWSNASTTHCAHPSTQIVPPPSATDNAPSSQQDIVTITSYTTIIVTVPLTSTLPNVPQPNPTRCIIVETNSSGKLYTLATDIPGVCVAPTPAPTAPQYAGTVSRPTVWVTQATGCITVSNIDGTMVSVASNPPVSGTCPIPT